LPGLDVCGLCLKSLLDVLPPYVCGILAVRWTVNEAVLYLVNIVFSTIWCAEEAGHNLADVVLEVRILPLRLATAVAASVVEALFSNPS
jgi:hypothetical protein